ncbi:MAG TPA: hypothetical protein VH560_17590, partial [Polyangia bacterium]|nr:hypothetical protein [Polyangia bacterium]
MKTFKATPMKHVVRRLGAVATLALPFLAGAGCNTYKYFDINVSFDSSGPTAFDDSSVGQIHTCVVNVTGADKTTFELLHCPSMNAEAPFETGSFEYSSYASSGTIDFEVDAYVGLKTTPDCLAGKGTIAVPVNGATTITGNLV